MNILQERLKEQKRMREKAALKKTPPSRRKEQYTPVEIDTGVDEVKLVDSATTDSESSGEGAFRRHPQCTKQPPPTPLKPQHSPSSSASENETTPKRKPLPPTPAKKPIEPSKKSIPIQVKREDTSRVPPKQGQSLVDRMNQPLPPTPAEEPLMSSSGGQNKASATTGSALLKEIIAKQGKKSSTGDVEKRSRKKQPIPTPTQRLPSQRNDSSKALAAVTTEQLHEPAGYANLPVHDAPYQNMGFGPDASVPPDEPDVLYENTSRMQKPKGNRSSPSGAQPYKGYLDAKPNGKEVSSTGSEYQNINARRPKVRESPQRY